MKKFVTKGLVYLLGIILITALCSALGFWLVRSGSFYKPSFVANSLEQSSFQTVIFGSSRGLAALDSKLINKELGGGSINLCMTDTALPTHFLMIKHFFEQGNTSEYVLLTLDIGDFESSEIKIGDGDFKFAPFSSEPYVQEFYKTYDQTSLNVLANANWFPLLAFSYYNSQLIYPSLVSALRPNYRYLFDASGDYSYPDYLSLDQIPEPAQRVTSLNNPILDTIDEYVKSQGSNLIIYIAPYLGEDIVLNDPKSEFVINHSRLLNEAEYFSDAIHLVNSGKMKATAAVISDLQIRFKDNN